MPDHATERGYGVPAINVNKLQQMHAIMEAAQETQSPVILQASAGARQYAVSAIDPIRFHQCDDGRLADGGRDDALER